MVVRVNIQIFKSLKAELLKLLKGKILFSVRQEGTDGDIRMSY